eukprot:Skav235142  [mRNA]  locus=scaffold1072:49794:54677:- [translate_table: standard]
MYHEPPFLDSYVRCGEALNPGLQQDEYVVPFGFSNPGGIRNKEEVIMSLGQGVWHFSETHLTSVTQRSFAGRMRALAASAHQDVRLHLGAPVAPRPGSEWAGTWAGVCVASHFPSHEVHLPYQHERQCGRVLTTCHYLMDQPFVTSVVYGYPAGPTWPRSKELTASLIEILSVNVVLGGHGPRMIGGDFNLAEFDLPCCHLWKRLGWKSAQTFAFEQWGQERKATCKHATERDFIWLSPEAQALCRYVDVTDFFSDHSLVTVGIAVSSNNGPSRQWPLPSKIPWETVSTTWTDQVATPQWDTAGDVDAQWHQLGTTLEDGLSGHLPTQPGASLQAHQRGRLQRCQPRANPTGRAFLRPSRPGEVMLRSDLSGSATKLWFKQLRRLQSFLAAARANKTTPPAITYRLELWGSIRRATGFEDGFVHWWSYHRRHDLPGTPRALPLGPPEADVAGCLFQTFKLCFEKFESWHLTQRTKLLRAKYESGMKGIFTDLRKSTRDKLDLLGSTEEYVILATDPDQQLVQVDRPILTGGYSKWTWDQEPQQVQVVDDCTIRTPAAQDLDFGHVLTQHRTLTQVTDLHHELRRFWNQTWNAWSEVDPSVWTRVTDFFTAYVPVLGLPLEPITRGQWKRVLRRFKSTAARGVDGISHVDLLHFPDAWTDRVLTLLNDLELGRSNWPQTLLYGMVNLLAKDIGSRDVSRFRPIVIFSVIYRAWASLRAKQLLVRLNSFMMCEAHGFRPGHEAAMLWMPLQAAIETAFQDEVGLCGLSTDLVRAFNHIPRAQTFALAAHLGVSDRVLVPWKSFLQQCTRAFVVRGEHSEPLLSSVGMPEGDALSVYAMLQLNFAWHLYMTEFAPQVRTLSFVDNLMLTSPSAGALARGWTCLETFFDMWNLRVDVQKSNCWATTKPLRQQMTPFPMTLVDHSAELGGALSFTKRQFTGVQQKRLAALGPRWVQLRNSQAPLWQKLASLPIVFWAAGLHGIAGNCLGQTHFDTLRSQAVKALRLNSAGVNPLLRLSLSSTPTADPGFWCLSNTVITFRRMLIKDPAFLNTWSLFMQHFDGKLFSGPCSQLLTVLHQIGWRIEVPFLVDQDGFRFNLIQVDCATLLMVLEDGWLQHVARQVQHRTSMSDLVGIDPVAVRFDAKQMTALDRALLGSLQSGAFIGNNIHAKYDVTKNKLCATCQVVDDPEHWLTCPRFQAQRAAIPHWQPQVDVDTQALRTHLLPSRSPWAVAWKTALMDLHDDTEFLSQPADGPQHIFSDGTCSGSEPDKFGAWGCINSSTQQLVALGHLAGLRQTSARAELSGAIAVIQWQLCFHVEVHLWLDCQMVASGISWVLEHGVAGPHWTDYDLWQQLEGLLLQLGTLEPHVHWVPSHLSESQMSCPFEDWCCELNNRIDRIVAYHNHNRPQTFKDLCHAAQHHHDTVCTRLRHLHAFYVAVAECRRAETSSTEAVAPETSDFDFEDHHSLHDLSSDDPHSLVTFSGWTVPKIPSEFMVNLLTWIFEHSDSSSRVYPLSFIELTLAFASQHNAQFPFWNPQTRCHELGALSLRFERPTLSQLLSNVRTAFHHFVKGCDCADVLFHGHNKLSLGLVRPVDGLLVRLGSSAVQLCHAKTTEFFSSRKYRRACDLARPI